MNDLEKNVQMALNRAASSVVLSPDMEMKLQARLTSRSIPAKRYIGRKKMAVALFFGLLFVVSTAYADSLSSKINLLFNFHEVPVVSNSGLIAINDEEQQKQDALNLLRKENQVSREKVEQLSPVPFVLPDLPDGYVLTEQGAIAGSVGYDDKEHKTLFIPDGSFAYHATFVNKSLPVGEQYESRIIVSYTFDASFSQNRQMELRGPEVSSITLDGVPGIEYSLVTEAWLEYSNGGLLRIGVSTPETWTAEQRRAILKTILQKTDLPHQQIRGTAK
ncbi:hypothetical protein SD71_15120 [Cohnella kolymensis]|uniref:DUF4367 domain-containing protein n=1 Tax=Cohnella kolymensis TaxID=1590652 RepID=A0ABR5A1S2_9BACL|nr:hypothetical protein [Cohnella kolymensis]KIL35009.1 hypothetical protein SD71_15120 [Cohnella kolymensis]